MARIKGRGSHALDQLEYDIFWTECRAIEDSRPEISEEEHEDDPQKEPPGGMSQISRATVVCAKYHVPF